MTTIVWDGKTLAGDRRVTGGGAVLTEMTKVARREDGALIGVAGELCTAAAFMRWFMGGEQGDQPSLMAANSTESCSSALVIRPNGATEYYDKCGWHTIESQRFAFGTGEDFALGAMEMGADARRAVEVASKFNIHTGDGVDVVSLASAPHANIRPVRAWNAP